MKFSIDLEPPFGLSAYWYAVGIGVFLLSFLLRFVVNKLFEVRVYSPFRLDRLHRESLRKVQEISSEYGKKELDSRAAHQQMSLAVRQFVQAVTGLPADKMVYGDMRALRRPDLADLIKDYYEPEFAFSPEAASEERTNEAITKGKALIDEVYKRTARENKTKTIASLRSGLNDIYAKVMRRTPQFLQKSVLGLIRGNSLKWTGSIEKELDRDKLDSYGAHEQMCEAVRSFAHAATGGEAHETASGVLFIPGRAWETAEIRKYFDPDDACGTSKEAARTIKKGKELIQEWA